jgi:hypothetical protein
VVLQLGGLSVGLNNPHGKKNVTKCYTGLELQWILWIFMEIGWGTVDWIHLAQDRDLWKALVNTVMNLRVPLRCWEVLEKLNNYRLLKKGSGPCS